MDRQVPVAFDNDAHRFASVTAVDTKYQIIDDECLGHVVNRM
jgi:hypothetical protein